MKMTTQQIDRLTTAQNSPANWNQDIMTFAGWVDTVERLETHIEYYEGRAAKYDALTEKQKKKYDRRTGLTLDEVAAL